MPPACVAVADELRDIEVIVPTTDDPTAEKLRALARMHVSMQGADRRFSVLSYDEDHGMSGGAILLEVGLCPRREDVLTFAQRYRIDGGGAVRLVGRLQVLGEELLPPDVRHGLSSGEWRELVERGASAHPSGGSWLEAHPAEPEEVVVRLGSLAVPIPPGWIVDAEAQSGGLVVSRLLPLRFSDHESSIVVTPLDADLIPGDSFEESVELLAASSGQDARVVDVRVEAGPVGSSANRIGRIELVPTVGEASLPLRGEILLVPGPGAPELLVLTLMAEAALCWPAARGALDEVLRGIRTA